LPDGEGTRILSVAIQVRRTDRTPVALTHPYRRSRLPGQDQSRGSGSLRGPAGSAPPDGRHPGAGVPAATRRPPSRQRYPVDTTRGPGIRIRVGTTPKRLERASTVFDPDDHYALLLDQTGRAFVEPDERTNDDLPESAQLATVVLREAVVQEFEHASLPRQSISTPRTAPVGNSCDSASESVLRDVFRLDPPVVRRPRSREGRRRAHRTGGVDRSERRRETRGRLVRRGARHGGAGLAVVGRDRNP